MTLFLIALGVVVLLWVGLMIDLWDPEDDDIFGTDHDFLVD